MNTKKNLVELAKQVEKNSEVMLTDKDGKLFIQDIPLYYAVKIGKNGIYTNFKEFIDAISGIEHSKYFVFRDKNDAVEWMNTKSSDYRTPEMIVHHIHNTRKKFVSHPYTWQYLSLLNLEDGGFATHKIDSNIYYGVRYNTAKKNNDNTVITSVKDYGLVTTNLTEAKKAYKEHENSVLHAFYFKTQAEMFVVNDTHWLSEQWRNLKKITRVEENVKRIKAFFNEENIDKQGIRQAISLIFKADQSLETNDYDGVHSFALTLTEKYAKSYNINPKIKVITSNKDFADFITYNRGRMGVFNLNFFFTPEELKSFKNEVNSTDYNEVIKVLKNRNQKELTNPKYQELRRRMLDFYWFALLDVLEANSPKKEKQATSSFFTNTDTMVESDEIIKPQRQHHQGYMVVENTKDNTKTVKNAKSEFDDEDILFDHSKGESVKLSDLNQD